MGKRFLVNDTFTDDDTGKEYVGGGIYDCDDVEASALEQWIAEDKVQMRSTAKADDDLDETIEEMKARHEEEDDDKG